MRLNLGAGNSPLEGYVNLDGAQGDEIFPLPYQNEIDEIRASHVLEHLDQEMSVDAVFNWVDALKVGGLLKIAVPDFNDLVRRMTIGEDLPYESIIMGGQVNGLDYHKSLWTCGKLRTIMAGAGLVDIQTWQSEINDCAAYPFSLNLQGTKCAKDNSTM